MIPNNYARMNTSLSKSLRLEISPRVDIILEICCRIIQMEILTFPEYV
jgi:hypothetical protein